MMRASFQPLAHLVDAAAAKWLAAEHGSCQAKSAVRNEITRAFRIGDMPELTFHGFRYLLIISRTDRVRGGAADELRIEVHEISSND